MERSWCVVLASALAACAAGPERVVESTSDGWAESYPADAATVAALVPTAADRLGWTRVDVSGLGPGQAVFSVPAAGFFGEGLWARVDAKRIDDRTALVRVVWVYKHNTPYDDGELASRQLHVALLQLLAPGGGGPG